MVKLNFLCASEWNKSVNKFLKKKRFLKSSPFDNNAFMKSNLVKRWMYQIIQNYHWSKAESTDILHAEGELRWNVRQKWRYGRNSIEREYLDIRIHLRYYLRKISPFVNVLELGIIILIHLFALWKKGH